MQNLIKMIKIMRNKILNTILVFMKGLVIIIIIVLVLKLEESVKSTAAVKICAVINIKDVLVKKDVKDWDKINVNV